MNIDLVFLWFLVILMMVCFTQIFTEVKREYSVTYVGYKGKDLSIGSCEILLSGSRRPYYKALEKILEKEQGLAEVTVLSIHPQKTRRNIVVPWRKERRNT